MATSSLSLFQRLARLCVLGVVVLGVGTATIIHFREEAEARADVRACYANQKTLSGALEMYTMDY